VGGVSSQRAAGVVRGDPRQAPDPAIKGEATWGLGGRVHTVTTATPSAVCRKGSKIERNADTSARYAQHEPILPF